MDLSDVETKKEFVSRLKMKESSWAPFPEFSEGVDCCQWMTTMVRYSERIIGRIYRIKGGSTTSPIPSDAFRADMHTAIVNQAGFRKANVRWADVKKNTTHDYYRRFRDYINFDTGEVKDDAMQLFQKVLPKRTKKERKKRFETSTCAAFKVRDNEE